MEPIKDFYSGRIQGWLEEKSNGDIWAYDWSKRLVGKYIKSLNITRDFYGRNVSRGNVLSNLILMSTKNEK